MDRHVVGTSFRWVTPIPGIPRVPLVDGDRIGLSSYDHHSWQTRFACIDVHTGATIWATALPSTAYARACRSGDLYFVPYGPTKIVALARGDGDVAWTLDLGTRVRSSPAPLGRGIVMAAGPRVVVISDDGRIAREHYDPDAFFFGGVTVAGGDVYVLGSENRDGTASRAFVAALDRDKLTPRWRTTTGRGVVVSCDTSGVDVDESVVYAGTIDGAVALDRATGRVVWEAPLAAPVHRSRPAADGDVVYYTSIEHGAFALDARTGRPLWHRQLHPEGCWGPPAPFGEHVLVHSGPSLVVLGRDGDDVAQIPVGCHAYTAPVPVDGDVVISGGDVPDHGCLYRIDVASQVAAGARAARVVPLRHEDNTSGSLARIEVDVGAGASAVHLDARPLGESSHEPLAHDGRGTWSWVGHVPGHVKGGGWVGVLTVQEDGEERPMTVLADFADWVAAPARAEIDDARVGAQSSRTGSGAATVAAFLRRHGLEPDEGDIDDAASWIIEHHDLDPHQKWREGALRLFHAGGKRRLPEMESDASR